VEPHPPQAGLQEVAELDAEIAAWNRSAPPPGEGGFAAARQQLRDRSASALSLVVPPYRTATEQTQQIAAGAGRVPVRILRPAGTAGPVPTVVYFHAGGWVLGGIDTHIGPARRLCAETGSVVVSVEYRLAPEHPFPEAFDDALASASWAAERLGELGGSASLAVVGDSAGGQLAASVALAWRGDGRLAAQGLIYPVLDATGRYADPEVNRRYPSRGRAGVTGLTLARMAGYADAYLGEHRGADWRVSPLRAATVKGLPPAVVHTAGLDILHSEGLSYAQRLRGAGVEVIARSHPHLPHSYFGLGGVSRAADTAAAAFCADLRRLLNLPSVSVR